MGKTLRNNPPQCSTYRASLTPLNLYQSSKISSYWVLLSKKWHAWISSVTVQSLRKKAN